MNLNEIKNNLRTFFRGKETKEGHQLIDRWYHSFDDKPNELTDYSDEDKKKLGGELWADIDAATGGSDKKQLPIHSYSLKRISWSSKIAAGFIITLLASLSVLYFQGVLMPGQAKDETVEYLTSSNPAGEVSRITLSDGTTVWLSAASTLQYPRRFDEGKREVTLEGEAFFDVAHNPDKPFVVNSGQLQTKVLGTSFNIRGFEGEEDMQVTVATGRVSVEQNADSVGRPQSNDEPIAVLTPNQQLVFDTESSTGITQDVNSTLYTSWKDGKLIFENHSFEEIGQRLERWYGVEIQFADPVLKQIRFKIIFDNNSLEHALQMLQVIESFEFKMEDNQVWIKSAS